MNCFTNATTAQSTSHNRDRGRDRDRFLPLHPPNPYRLPLLTLALATSAILIHCVPAAIDALTYDRTAIAGGQVWRLWSGHLTHWSWNQLVWDLIPFAVLGGYCEWRSRARWFWLMVTAPFAVSLAVWLLAPGIPVYRGLSAIDSAFYALALGCLLNRRSGQTIGSDKWIAILAGAGFLAKILYELLTGGSVFVVSGGLFVALPLTHLIGFLTGLLVSAAARMVPFRAPYH